MFTKKTNEEIGLYLKFLIKNKFSSVRQFCIEYLKKDNSDYEDPTIIRNLTNRFSQILSGNKAIQTYDLPFVTDLLEVSCEDLLSCGESKIPLVNRKTNYAAACSDNELDWAAVLDREDHIAAYGDEYRKTILDYAIEFKNYKLIRYLIDKGYISLISDEYRHYDFGAHSNIEERPYDSNKLRDEFITKKILRTRILSLAIENNDVEALEKFKARELGPQQGYHNFLSEFDFSEYMDERYINEIASSSDKIFNYFIEEYSTEMNKDKDDKIEWLFPFISELIEACIANKNKERAIKAISVVLEHHKNAFEKLRKTFLYAAKQFKDKYFYSRSFEEAIEMATREMHIDKYQNFISFSPHHLEGIETLAFGIYRIKCSSSDKNMQSMIDESNDIYQKILTIPDHLIKKESRGN